MAAENRNPFNPSFGKVPSIFIDREEYIDEISEGLSNLDSPWQTTMVSGVRGVGKTAFLADVCRRFEKKKQWIVADIASNGHVLDTLVQSVHEKASTDVRKAIDAIEGVSISLFGIGAGYTTGKEKINYQLLLEKILKELQKKNKYLLVAIDEVVPTKQIRQFAAIYQIMVRKNYPIALIMTGLPKNISELQNDNTLTFLLRSSRVNLPLLDEVAVQYSYKEVFERSKKEISLKTLRRMTALTNGYSYAFQLLGFLVWNTGADRVTDETLDAVMYKYKEQLFRNAYSKIYEELSKVDRDFVLAMAAGDEDSVTMKEIAGRMGKKNNYISTYKRRLIDNGVIKAEQYGSVEFALPLFKDYLIEFRLEE